MTVIPHLSHDLRHGPFCAACRISCAAEKIEDRCPAVMPDPAYDTPKPDVVNRPAHYSRWKIEPITFIMENGLNFEIGSAVKYVVRAGFKIYDGMTAEESELTDLRKAKRMIEMRIGKLEGKPVY